MTREGFPNSVTVRTSLAWSSVRSRISPNSSSAPSTGRSRISAGPTSISAPVPLLDVVDDAENGDAGVRVDVQCEVESTLGER